MCPSDSLLISKEVVGHSTMIFQSKYWHISKTFTVGSDDHMDQLFQFSSRIVKHKKEIILIPPPSGDEISMGYDERYFADIAVNDARQM